MQNPEVGKRPPGCYVQPSLSSPDRPALCMVLHGLGGWAGGLLSGQRKRWCLNPASLPTALPGDLPFTLLDWPPLKLFRRIYSRLWKQFHKRNSQHIMPWECYCKNYLQSLKGLPLWGNTLLFTRSVPFCL